MNEIKEKIENTDFYDKMKSFMCKVKARDFDFEEAEKCLKEAEVDMRKAHQAQFDTIQDEANGKPVDVHIILVHAQDHLTMAMMARDNAEEFINLYKIIKELKEAK